MQPGFSLPRPGVRGLEESRRVAVGHLVRTGVAPKAHRELIHSLQQVHDLYTPAEWPKELRQRLVHLGFSREWCDRLINSQTQENGNG